jgi:hypothetical protein
MLKDDTDRRPYEGHTLVLTKEYHCPRCVLNRILRTRHALAQLIMQLFPGHSELGFGLSLGASAEHDP